LCPDLPEKETGNGQIWRKVDMAPITNYNALIFGHRPREKTDTFSGHKIPPTYILKNFMPKLQISLRSLQVFKS